MKKTIFSPKTHLLVLLYAIGVLYNTLSAQPSQLKHYRDSFYTFLHKTPLYTGYHSTPEEKEAAKKRIQELETQKDDLIKQLREYNELNAQECIAIQKKIVQIDRALYRQKIITGEEQTPLRKAMLIIGTIGTTIGSATILYKLYQLLPTSIIPATPTTTYRFALAPKNPTTQFGWAYYSPVGIHPNTHYPQIFQGNAHLNPWYNNPTQLVVPNDSSYYQSFMLMAFNPVTQNWESVFWYDKNSKREVTYPRFDNYLISASEDV